MVSPYSLQAERAGPRTGEDGELLAKSDILESQLATSLEGRDESANKQRNHAGMVVWSKYSNAQWISSLHLTAWRVAKFLPSGSRMSILTSRMHNLDLTGSLLAEPNQVLGQLLDLFLAIDLQEPTGLESD